MTEHLTLDAPKSLNGEIYPLQSPDSDPRTEATKILGAVSLLRSLDTIEPPEAFDDTVITGGTETMTNNQEGVQNAELFKRKYDEAVESIDSALQAGSGELSDKIPAILSSLESLSATPYVSSAPDFVEMLDAAKGYIEAVNSFVTLNDEDTDPVIAHALSRAKQQLAGTLIAYRPQR